MNEPKHEIVGVCSKCAGVVFRIGNEVKCSACGSVPVVETEKPAFIREDLRGDSTRMLRYPRPGGKQLNG